MAVEIDELREVLGDEADGKDDEELLKIVAQMQKQVEKSRAKGESDAALRTRIDGMQKAYEDRLAALEEQTADRVSAPRTIESPEQLADVTARKFKLDADGVVEFFKDTQIQLGGPRPHRKAFSELLATPPERASEEVKAFQEFCDDAFITAATMQATIGHAVPISGLKMWQSWSRGTSELRKAMDIATSGEGSEWVPTFLSPQIIRKVRVQPRFGGLFPLRDLSGKEDWPIEGSDPTAYMIGEAQEDESVKIHASTPGTAKIAPTLKKVGGRVLISAEAEEDMTPDVLADVKLRAGRALADARDDIIINGDTTSTHMDSDVTSADDVRKGWNGIRDAAAAASTTKDLSTFTGDTCAGLLGKLLQYAQDPAGECIWTANVALLPSLLVLRDSQNNPLYLTMDKVGPQAANVTGQVAQLFGAPLVWCAKARISLNASGVYDGSTTDYTNLYVANRNGFTWGRKGPVTVRGMFDIERDRHVLVFRERIALAQTPTASSSEPTCAVGYKITTPT
ncbi:MAG: phage major capsid protein [Armatimonadota bacterium]|jgi:HK97 family phage major capsid protein